MSEKSAGRATFSSEVCEDITGGAVGVGGTGHAVGTGVTGSRDTSGVGDEGCSSWGFLGW